MNSNLKKYIRKNLLEKLLQKCIDENVLNDNEKNIEWVSKNTRVDWKWILSTKLNSNYIENKLIICNASVYLDIYIPSEYIIDIDLTQYYRNIKIKDLIKK